MAFSELPTDLQNLYMVNIELGLKIAFIGFLIFICIYCINKLKEQKPTPYLLIAQFRSLAGIVSYGVLFLVPLISVFLFYPQFNIDVIQITMYWGYFISFLIIGTIFVINIFYWTTNILIHIGGYDPNEQDTNKVLKDLSKVSGGIKFKMNRFVNWVKGN